MVSIEQITKDYFLQIRKCRMFRNLNEEQTADALRSFGAVLKEYDKGEYLHHTGTPMKNFGLVLSGIIHVCRDDIDADRMIMATVESGETFGEALCYLKYKSSPVYIFAEEKCKILWLNPNKIFQTPSSNSESKLQKEFTAMLAERTLTMNSRIQVLSKTTLRNKLITYFGIMANNSKSNTFSVPFNRETMATYIGTNRSALSRELSKMKSEGLIDYRKNTFKILK